MGSLDDFGRARDQQAGQMYTQKHYGRVMFLLFLKRWGLWIALGIFLLYCYSIGRP